MSKVIVHSDAYKQFVNSLRTKQTKITYTEWLNDFLKYLDEPDCDKLLDGEYTSKQIQSKIIDYIVDMKDSRKLSPNSIRNRISAVQHFFEINDFEGINWKKVKKFKREYYTIVDDRPYTRDEISTLIDNAHSLRNKAIILLFSSSGLRVGGLIRLQLKHLKRIDKYNIYQIEVYKKSKENYTTFCTPEARRAIDSYLEWRRRLGENLSPESPLFRTEFNTEDRTHAAAGAPAKALTRFAVSELIRKLRFKTGMIEEQHLTENVKLGRPRTDIMCLHGFRKFFSTTLETEGVNTLYIDFLLGHDVGLKKVYSKPTSVQLLEGNGNKVLGYVHGIDFLTINEEDRLKLKVKRLTDKEDEMMLMKVKHEKEMQSMRNEMENRFKQIFTRIDSNKLSM